MRVVIALAVVLATLAAAQSNDTVLNSTLTTPLDNAFDALNSTANGTLNGTGPVGASVPLAAPIAASVPTSGGCARQCVRKEWRALSQQERQAYLAAVKQLQSMPATNGSAAAPTDAPAAPTGPSGPKGTPKGTPKGRLQARQDAADAAPKGASAPLNGPSEYDRFVKMHLDAERFSHGTDFFLPWHRGYLRAFEIALQQIDPSICLPYWSWAMDSQAPELSPLLSSDYFGGNGQGPNNCVSDGAFAGAQRYYPEPHCLSRNYAYDGGLGAFQSIETVNRVVSTSKDYSRFRKQVEGTLHGGVHNAFGGDFSTMSSPNDPLFFLHHGFVDYAWALHQRRNGFAISISGLDQPMPTIETYRGQDVLDHRQLCYDYADVMAKDLGDDTVVPPPPPPAKTPRGPRNKDEPLPELTTTKPLPSDDERYSSRDRSNLVAIRYADPIPQAWCERNHIDYTEVTTYEKEYREVTTQLNKITGYVSPCALIKRPTLQARLVKERKVTHFYVDTAEQRYEIAYKPEVAEADPYQAVANVQQRVFACSPDVERPPEEYRATVQKLIGNSAFSGAGDPLRITDMDSIKGAAAATASGVATVMLASVLAAAFAQL